MWGQSKVAEISSLRGVKRQSHPEKRMDCHEPLALRNDEHGERTTPQPPLWIAFPQMFSTLVLQAAPVA
jgi:hypothetical protein